MKSTKPRNKAQRKVDYKNYLAITMSRNYDRKLSASIYHQAKNVGTSVSKNDVKKDTAFFVYLSSSLQQ